ncbi:MAG: hypothetical protein SGI73_14780 [Chloroflexota bacterium]|nr:hypothetical protein [Chloroflexota bacterium]
MTIVTRVRPLNPPDDGSIDEQGEGISKFWKMRLAHETIFNALRDYQGVADALNAH